MNSGSRKKQFLLLQVNDSLFPIAVRLAYEAAGEKNAHQLDALEEIMEASRIPFEIRDASRRLGSRFVKTLEKMELSWMDPFFWEYLEKRSKKTICHPCAYGAVCACAGILAEDAMLHFLYAQASAMVTNCVKLIQSDGQRMLSELYPLLEEMVTLAGEAGPEMLCASTPAFDLRSIQHETLYSRLYMS